MRQKKKRRREDRTSRLIIQKMPAPSAKPKLEDLSFTYVFGSWLKRETDLLKALVDLPGGP